jgi:uncharacterized protein YjbI with pentapeptide repeats
VIEESSHGTGITQVRFFFMRSLRCCIVILTAIWTLAAANSGFADDPIGPGEIHNGENHTNHDHSYLAPPEFGGGDLQGLSATSATLNLVNFTGDNLRCSAFIFSDLLGAQFFGADLSNSSLLCSLDPVNLQSTDLRQAELGGADFTGALFNNFSGGAADFTGAFISQGLGAAGDEDAAACPAGSARPPGPCRTVFPDANLVGTTLQDVDLSGVDLAGADLGSANLDGDLLDVLPFNTRLVNADLNQAQLDRIQARDADFQGANLRCATFLFASLVNANLRDADVTCDPDGVNLQSTDLRGADLRGSDFTGALFNSNQGGAADFTGAEICQHVDGESCLDGDGAPIQLPCSLGSARAPGTCATVLRDANLVGTILQDVDLSGVDLAGANLASADLRSSRLCSANITPFGSVQAIMSNAQIAGADFGGANLAGVINLPNVVPQDQLALLGKVVYTIAGNSFPATVFPAGFVPDPAVWEASPRFCPSSFDSFEAYPIQTDTTGITVAGVPNPVFSVTADGGNPAFGNVVITATGSFAASAAIRAEGENQFTTITATTGTRTTQAVVLVANLPGLTDASNAGPFAKFAETPQDLIGQAISLKVRGAIEAGAASPLGIDGDADCPLEMQTALTDADGNTFATDPVAVTGEFVESESLANAGTFNRPIGGAVEIDLSRISGISFLFFETCAVASTIPSATIDVDAIVVPEPSKVLLGATSLAVLGALAGVRRRDRYGDDLRSD